MVGPLPHITPPRPQLPPAFEGIGLVIKYLYSCWVHTHLASQDRDHSQLVFSYVISFAVKRQEIHILVLYMSKKCIAEVVEVGWMT